MSYASQSFGGGCTPTYLVSTITSSSTTATFGSLADWVEVDSNGAKTAQPLGTSGPFCIKLDWGLATEETVKCTSLNPTTGVITFATRGFDGTTAQAHTAGSSAKLNVFPTDTATDWVNLQATATTASTDASSALSAANSKVASVTAGDSSITIAGTTTAPTVAVASSGVTAGSYGSSLATPTITVDAKGRVTAATTNIALSPQTTATTTTTFGSTSMRHYPCDTTAGAFTVTLPLSPANGGQWLITLKAGTNALTIAAQTGNTINGLASIKLTAAGQSVLLQYISSTSIFTIISASSTPNTGNGFAVGGDITGFMPNPTVDGLQGNAVSATAPTSGQALVWDGTAWAPTTPSATFSGEITGTDFKATGLTGATAASRYVGGTTSGAPTSGTFLVGDFVVDQTATIWVCIVAGTPGTWSPTESQNVRSTGSSTTAAAGEIIIATGGSSGVLITLPTSAVGGATFGIVNNNNNSISIKGGTYPLLIAGTNYGAGISYTVATNGVYLFVFDNVANRWICTSTNDIGDMVNYSDVTLDKFGAPAANLPMNANKITGLANGTVSTDAAAFGQILPAAGGTMSGAIAMGSNRITGMPTAGAATDPLRADAGPATPNPSIHAGGSYAFKAWNADPGTSVLITSATAQMVSGVHQFTSISIPYAMTLNQIWVYQTIGAAYQATGGYYNIGIFSTAGTLLASTGNLQSSGLTGLTGFLGWTLSAPYSIAAGNYMIGFIFYQGTGAGSPVAPTFGKASSGSQTQLNVNCPTVSSGKLDQRCCSAGTGQTSIYSTIAGVTPTLNILHFWTAVA